MRILCICEHGNIRSVALAYILKHLFNQEAIAIGSHRVEDSTIEMLSNWADKIVVLDKQYYEKHANPKSILFDIGEDVWHDPFAQGLRHQLYKKLSKHPELWINEN